MSFKLCYYTNIKENDKVTPIYECYMLEKNKNGIGRLQLFFDASTGEALELW